jgi:acetyl-CoA carboxylase biotin carboxyl carrier protein
VVPADDISPAAGSEPGPFDVRTIRQLIAMMGRHDLNEIDLQDGVKRIRLRRGLRGTMAVPTVLPTPVMAPPAETKPASDAKPSGESASAKPARPTIPIKSPGVGTFYLSAKPGADPFVKMGSRVTPATVVGLLEAMKIFNEVPAECSGVIVEVLVQDKQAVEYGQVLFQVDLAG